MKERYFTPENIYEKSQKIFHKLRQYREKHRINFKPGDSALLILDMQRYFLDKSSHAYIPSATAVIPNAKNLMNAFLKNNLTVILTQHINAKDDANPMSKWWKDSIREEDIRSEIIPELNHSDTTVIKKTQYDAFHKTSLENLLKEKRITQIVITGVMTHLCCETTARTAFIKGFTVFFTIDGTATYNEEFHHASLLNLSHGFAIPVLCKELQDTLESV